MSKRLWLWILWAALLPKPGFAALSALGVEDRLIVAFKPEVSALDQRQIVESLGLKVLDEISALRVVLAQAPSGKSFEALAGLTANPKVLRVGHDIWIKWIETPASFQETPLPSVESVLKELPRLAPSRRLAAAPEPGGADGEVQWGVKRVNAPAAWPTNQGDGVKVAIVDTGIDPEHPELKGKIAGGYNAVDKNAPWADDHFHGTHVAGIVAAKLDGKGVVGAAPRATLYAVKVLTKDGSGSLFSIMDGLIWCAQNGIQVVNMSLGAPQEIPFLEYALQFANNAGVTIIAAAGNDGKAVNYPAAYKEAIAVSALCPPGIEDTKLCPSSQEGIASFSSRGPEVAFIAPGVKVPSSVPLSHDPSGVKAYSGTSMATPHVAGLAALAVAKGAQGPEAVRAALKAAAEKLPGLSDSEQGAGVVNAARLAR